LPGLPPGQRQPKTPPTPATLQPGDEVVTEPAQQKIVNKQAVFSGLDKITGRIISFEAAVDETVQFGALQITPRVCYSRPQTEAPNTTGFLEVDEVTFQNEHRRIFTGWMYASSPGLHGIEHAVYDVWLTECKGGTEVIAEPKDVDPADDALKRDQNTVRQRRPQPQPAALPGQGPGVLPGGRIDVQPQQGIPVQPRQPTQRYFPTNDPAGVLRPPGNIGIDPLRGR
jgi:hypothetical protein